MAHSIMSSYKISKPPGYKEVNSDGDSMTPPASPTTDPTNSLKNDNKGNQSSAKDDVDGGGENDDERKIPRAERGDVGIVNGILNDGKEDKINNQLILPVDDVVTDGAGEKNSLPVERKKGVVEKGVQERKGVVTKDAMDGGAQCNKGGVEENGTPPVESQGHLDQRKEKAMTTTHRDVSEENVYGFIDVIEEDMMLMSEEEGGATGRLEENVKTFLPLVLYMLNEVTILRDKVKEVRQLNKEIEERDAKDATIGTTFGKPSTVSSSVNPFLDGKGTDDTVTTDQTQKQAPGEDDRMKKELKKLRSQNKKLQRVNHSWEKYGQNLSAKNQIELKKKTAQLAASDERRKDLEKRLDEKFKEYDQTLMHARHSEGQQKAAAEQYKKDRDTLRKKYGDMTTKLREWIKEKEDKDNEIKRLNKESPSPMEAVNDIPISVTSTDLESFPRHPSAVVHQKLYERNPFSSQGTSSNRVWKSGSKRRTSVYRCPSILTIVQTFLQMIIALTIILAGSPILVAGSNSIERVTLQAGKPGVVPFHLSWSPSNTSQIVPFYTIQLKSKPRPFCNNGKSDIEGFKSPSQLPRFTSSVTDLDTSPCVNLMIDNVDTLDEGVYVLTAFWHSFENVRYETMMKEIVVQIPPGRAKCFITLSGNVDYPYEVHCRATTRSVATTLSCYQNDQKIDVKRDITDNGLITRGIFWLPRITHFSCCSHDVTLNVSQTMCNDFEWPHGKETTSLTVNTVPTVTTPTPQVESHTGSGACRQFMIPSLWHFEYLFVNLLAFATIY